MAALAHVGQQAEQRQRLRQQRGPRRTGDAQPRERAHAEDQQRVERDVQRHRQQQEAERRARVAGTAQRRAEEGEGVQRRRGQEDDPQVGLGQRQRRGRGTHRPQQRMRHEPAGDGDQHRNADEEGGAGAHHPPCLDHVARAHRLADQDGGGHADAEHRADQEEHDVVGVGRGGQRRFAEEPADPDRVDRAVERLGDVAGQDRQGEQQQVAPDGAFGQRAGGRGGGGHGRRSATECGH